DSAADGADGSSDAGGGSADDGSADGAGADASGSEASGSDANGSKDGGDLPRTGVETANVVAAALALIVAGRAVVTMVRRRRSGISAPAPRSALPPRLSAHAACRASITGSGLACP